MNSRHHTYDNDRSRQYPSGYPQYFDRAKTRIQNRSWVDGRCPLRVISGSRCGLWRLPLFPQKRTSTGHGWHVRKGPTGDMQTHRKMKRPPSEAVLLLTESLATLAVDEVKPSAGRTLHRHELVFSIVLGIIQPVLDAVACVRTSKEDVTTHCSHSRGKRNGPGVPRRPGPQPQQPSAARLQVHHTGSSPVPD